MKLTSMDIHHKEFRHSVRGYNPDEVDQFLVDVADEFDRLFKENIDLSERLDAADVKVRSYTDMEKTLHNTMLAAQQSAEEIQNKARKEAELLLRDAEIKAKELIQASLAEKQRTQSEFMRIKAAEDEFRSRFRAVLDDYAHRVNQTAIPVDPEIASLVGIAAEERVMDLRAQSQYAAAPAPSPEVAPEPLAAPAPVPAPVVVPAPQEAPDAMQAAPSAPQPSYEEALAAAAPERPRAHVPGRPADGTQPLQLDAEPPAFVTSLTLGETAAPDLPAEPTFEEPATFDVPDFHKMGQRDDDLDIEEID
jgi:cell division initiation protein